jgi:L-alanine-DL-glutamate epimerase-like enolase superfamily enzyme
MSDPIQNSMRVVEVHASCESIAYRTPMKFGGRVVTEATLLNVEITAENRTGQRAVGLGSMPLGNAWAWPSQVVSSANALAVMQEFGEETAKKVEQFKEWSCPLDLGHWLSHQLGEIARHVAIKNVLNEQIPKLAQLVAASPVDAALHDAYGKLHGASSYDLLGSNHVNQDLSYYLNKDFQGEFLDRYTRREPQVTIPLYHLVGALDPLTLADVATPVGDGLPETLGEWIPFNGLTHLKIKLAGDDLAWDIARILQVEHVTSESQAKRNVNTWLYSCDFNEKCANVEYLLEFLRKVEETSPEAFKRIQYIEQPTSRHLKQHAENRMHRAAALKPIVIDEALTDLESLLIAQEQGYSGVALKACKGQTESLLMAAAAQKYRLFLCVQDLTCPGYSFLHSASLAARIPTVAAIEGNARQYCPAGNTSWMARYPAMFKIQDGTVGTGCLTSPGLCS